MPNATSISTTDAAGTAQTVSTIDALIAVLNGSAIIPKTDVALLSNASATGSAVAVSAGRYNWYAYGTWNGATAQLQWSPDAGTTWINVDGATLTANGGWSNITIAAGQARVSFTGSPTSITSKLGGV